MAEIIGVDLRVPSDVLEDGELILELQRRPCWNPRSTSVRYRPHPQA